MSRSAPCTQLWSSARRSATCSAGRPVLCAAAAHQCTDQVHQLKWTEHMEGSAMALCVQPQSRRCTHPPLSSLTNATKLGQGVPACAVPAPTLVQHRRATPQPTHSACSQGCWASCWRSAACPLSAALPRRTCAGEGRQDALPAALQFCHLAEHFISGRQQQRLHHEGGAPALSQLAWVPPCAAPRPQGPSKQADTPVARELRRSAFSVTYYTCPYPACGACAHCGSPRDPARASGPGRFWQCRGRTPKGCPRCPARYAPA